MLGENILLLSYGLSLYMGLNYLLFYIFFFIFNILLYVIYFFGKVFVLGFGFLNCLLKFICLKIIFL